MTHFFSWIESRMQRLRRWAAPLAVLVLVAQLWLVDMAPAEATAVYELPSLLGDTTTWVVDEGDVLSRLNQGNISSELDSLARATGYRVRLVTLHRLDYGETIDSFADQLFTTWFPDAEAQADEVLIVLDTVTNSAGIKTGDRVKPVLPDETANSVAQETLLVPLRSGNRYNQAFLDATNRLKAVLSGEPDPGPPVVTEEVSVDGTFASPEETAESNATVWVIGLLLAATIIPMVTYYWYVR